MKIYNSDFFTLRLSFVNEQHPLSTVFLDCFHCSPGSVLTLAFSQSAGVANFSVRLSKLTLASQALQRENGNLIVEINAGKELKT